MPFRSYSVEIWKRFRKWGGIPTGITQNIKDLLASREIENIFENSDFIYMLNQAAGDRQILAKQLNISPHQLSYVTNSGEGEGLIFYGSTIIPFKDKFDKSLRLYALMTTKPSDLEGTGEKADLSVYETNMNILYKELTELGFTCVKPGGTFYIFPKALEEDAKVFSQKALKYDLVLVPGDSFGAPGYFRMAYCVDTEKVERSLEALRKFVKTEYATI